MAVFFRRISVRNRFVRGLYVQENRAEKRKRGKLCKDWVRYPIFTNTPLFLFYELFFNTANPLTE